MAWRDWVFGLFGRRARSEESSHRRRGAATHVVILDGTMSSLENGFETNAGLTLGLLKEAGQSANTTIYYEAGIQWRDWSGTWGVMTGKGINKQIERAYGVLATRYRPGDKIVLIGYSRGAYAVRSLAGVIGFVGLLRHDEATVRAVRQAYRHYKLGTRSKSVARFRELYCHENTKIEAVAVWDTVKALGLRLPIIWRWAQAQHSFHDHQLGDHVKNGFHAIAMDERRETYAPVMWHCPPDWDGHVDQVWFKGCHGDIGGQLKGFEAARPLANIPLVWMLENLDQCGLALPDGWHDRFEQNVDAPSVGSWRGWAKLFWSRRKRKMLYDPSENIHPTVKDWKP